MVALVLAVAGLTAQQPTTPTPPVDPNTPVLSETQLTQLQNVQLQQLVAAKDYEIAQYKYDIAQKRVQAFVAGLARPGYTLDTRTGLYTKNP